MELADGIDVEANFESTIPRHRVRRKKANFTYESKDDPIEGPKEKYKAEKRLCGTFSSDKNEILFSEFQINYNNEPVMYRKGTTLLRKRIRSPKHDKSKQVIFPVHEDMIQETFWQRHPEILSITSNQYYKPVDTDDLPELVMSQLHLSDRKQEKKIEDDIKVKILS